MSASANNSGPPHPWSSTSGPSPAPNFPRADHRDLEILLALSSLHEQIRRRHARELNKGSRLTSQDAWELKQFGQDEVLQLVADRALTITGADGTAVALVEGNGIVCRASAGEIAPEKGTRLDPLSGFSGACLRTGEIVRCDDSEKDKRVSMEACRRLNTRSMIAVPLSTSKAIVGVLEAFSTEPHGFNDSDVRSLMLLSELILDAMKPEDEDRLAEISQHVLATPATTPLQSQIRMTRLEESEDSNFPRPESSKSKSNARLVFFPEHDPSENSRPGLKLVVVLVLLAIALGAGLWLQMRHTANRKVEKPLKAPIAALKGEPALTSSPENIPQETDQRLTESSAEGTENSSHPLVTGVRHWVSADSSTVVIDLEDQVQYEAHRLNNPERIYFDLLDTRLAHGLAGSSIEVNDPLLQRIRIAQPRMGVTRVVLDTRGASNYAVSMESSPYRLVVEVGKLGSKLGPKSKMELFAPEDNANTQANAGLPPLTHATGAVVSADAVPSRQDKSSGVDRAPGLCIVLDAGHGGWDLGTVGRKGLQEKDLTMDVVQRLGVLLQNRLGANVIYTRHDDSYVALEKRAEIANLSQANLFVSVHANYSGYVSARGVETYYSNTYSSVKARVSETEPGASLQNIDWTKVDIREKVQESHHLAGFVQRSLYDTIATKNPGIRDRGVKEAQYVVLTGTSMPAILAEVSFVSSPTDAGELQSAAYRQRIAEALYKGIARYQEAVHRTTIAALATK